MKKIKTVFLRALLLNKRLLKKPSFVLILCMIPLLTVSMVFFANEDSGILTVTLCAEDSSDELANAVIDDLLENKNVFRFVKAKTADEAHDSVVYGKSDAAWIFSSNLQDKIESFVSGMNTPFITVVQRENDVALQLSHEKLCGAVFPYVSREIFKKYMLNNVFTPDEITEEQIYEYYEKALGGGNLITFKKIDGTPNATDSNYLTAPLRGILALAVLLCGLAAAMYHQADRENRVYDWLSPTNHIIPGIATISAAVFDSTVIAVIALGLSGLFGSPILEITASLSYVLATTAFCTLVGTLTRKAKRTGEIIPFLIILGLVISPIFFNFVALKPFQIFLPTYYYLYAVHQPIYILYTLVYSAITVGISFLINLITEK